jgi:hypothetical protein
VLPKDLPTHLLTNVVNCPSENALQKSRKWLLK